uniref:Uncharacterized protein n=1 Tax=Anguilla anguilla TaxID=7936 RepID=A0A0E9SSH3_ANGAN
MSASEAGCSSGAKTSGPNVQTEQIVFL